jgi:hypothetical protein
VPGQGHPRRARCLALGLPNATSRWANHAPEFACLRSMRLRGPDWNDACTVIVRRAQGVGMTNFTKLRVEDLSRLAVVAQSLDNRWVPPELLTRMVRTGQAMNDVRADLRKAVRADYIRALVNSRQVVVNRAFLYNNPILFEDFEPGAQHRDAFLGLLSSGAIVQMLVTEQSPIEQPQLLERPDAPDFGIVERGWRAWVSAAQEAHVSSLRFSWEDAAANQQVVRQRLAYAFTQKAQSLVGLHGPTLAADLGLDREAAMAIKRTHLREVAMACADLAADGKFATRETLYRQFLTGGLDPALGRFDRDSPHLVQVKQLIDLAYNVNLAVGLETLALTPADAMKRSVLQEWQALPRGRVPVSAEQVTAMVRGIAFDFIQQSLFIDTFGRLSLRDVLDLRGSQAWHRYADGLEALLGAPLDRFDDPVGGAGAVMASYVEVLAEVTRIATGRHRPDGPVARARDLTMVMTVEVAGALMEYEFLPTGLKAALAGAFLAPVVTEAATVSIRLGIRAIGEQRDRHRVEAALDTQTQVISGWVESASGFWAELVSEVQLLTGEDLGQVPLAQLQSSADGDPDQPADLAGALD